MLDVKDTIFVISACLTIAWKLVSFGKLLLHRKKRRE